MIKKKNIYANIEVKNIKRILKIFNSNTYEYSNGQTITYSIKNMNIIAILEEGSAQLIKFDYNGNRTIIDELKIGDIFSDKFFIFNNTEISVIATSNCKVTFIDYKDILKSINSNNPNISIFITNLLEILFTKINFESERIELLTTRSIRNKLLTYFEIKAKKHNSNSFDLDITYTDLADYLAVDRSAMMREMKNLKNEGFIKDINKKITILYL